jgi:WW domain-containing protein
MGPSSRELCVRAYADISLILYGDSTYRLPPSENGEWWEIGDESRGGIPYYYHTKTGETVWEKPDGFVIPLTVLQVRLLCDRFRRIFSDRRLLEYRVGSPSLQVIFFKCGSESVLTCNRTRATSRG